MEQHFHEALEHDLQKLTAEVKEKRLQNGIEQQSEKEILKQSLQAFSVQSATAPASSVPEEPSKPFLPDYMKASDPQVKLEVEKLVDLVFHGSLIKAISEAKKHSPFIEDAFHDALVDKLLPELKKRGAF